MGRRKTTIVRTTALQIGQNKGHACLSKMSDSLIEVGKGGRVQMIFLLFFWYFCCFSGIFASCGSGMLANGPACIHVVE